MEWARGLSKREAEDLLDWLENHGASGQVQNEGNQSFAVGSSVFRAIRDADGRLLIQLRDEFSKNS